MDFDGVDFLNNISNEGLQTNVETINTQKILNQLIRTNSSSTASSEITNEQIDLLLKSSNLLTDSNSSNSNSRRTSVDKRIRKKKRYLYEEEEEPEEEYSMTQDTLDSNTNDDENDDEEDEDDEDDQDEEDTNQFAVKRKTRSTSKNGKKISKTLNRTSKRKTSTDSNGMFKKESNKEAATRYRIKKMSEKDQLFETKVHLEKQNDDTQKKIDHVQTEINYLKNLLCQVLLTKGILS